MPPSSATRALVALAAALFASCSPPAPRSSGPLPHDAYVWQRDWSPAVREAVSRQAANFSSLVVLAAEISWKNRQPTVTRAELDPVTLRQANTRLGLALRIGPFPGPFDASDSTGRFLLQAARQLLDEARSNRLEIAELQLDFDAAESQLKGYQVWTRAIRDTIHPTPLRITALPSWLKRPAFPTLAASADGYILQVHSLSRPTDPDAPFDLCDPRAARRAVEQAGRLGIPFHVALPTYGYTLAFRPDGKFLGLSAEGPVPNWPEGTRIRTLKASPTDLAGLVQLWSSNRPAALRGIIWYRLPVRGDQLNWSSPTLRAVMEGRVPQSRLKVELHRPEPGLAEFELRNTGDGDYEGPCRFVARWRGARRIADDGWQGFTTADSQATGVEFSIDRLLLPAGESRRAGWLRLDHETDLQIALER